MLEIQVCFKILAVVTPLILLELLNHKHELKKRIIRRFYQGRFQSVKDWENAIYKRNIKWLNNTPVVKASDVQKTFLASIFTSKKGKESIQVWQGASIYLSLKEYMLIHQDEKCILEMKKFENNYKNRYKISEIRDSDYVMLAFSMLDIPQSDDLTKSMIQYVTDNQVTTGEILYKKGVKNISFVDTLGFICPFLTKYGVLEGDSKYVNTAVEQLELYLVNGTESNSKLPFHAYVIDSHIKKGVCDWARGLAWLLIGMMDSYLSLRHPSPYDEFFDKYLLKYAEILVSLQRSDGGFTWQLLSGYQTDSSATSVFGWYLACCAEIFGNKKYLKSAKQCRKFIMTVTNNNGIIDYCQGDTLGIGVYSRCFDYMPFAQGYALRMQKTIEDAERMLKGRTIT